MIERFFKPRSTSFFLVAERPKDSLVDSELPTVVSRLPIMAEKVKGKAKIFVNALAARLAPTAIGLEEPSHSSDDPLQKALAAAAAALPPKKQKLAAELTGSAKKWAAALGAELKRLRGSTLDAAASSSAPVTARKRRKGSLDAAAETTTNASDTVFNAAWAATHDASAPASELHSALAEALPRQDGAAEASSAAAQARYAAVALALRLDAARPTRLGAHVVAAADAATAVVQTLLQDLRRANTASSMTASAPVAASGRKRRKNSVDITVDESNTAAIDIPRAALEAFAAATKALLGLIAHRRMFAWASASSNSSFGASFRGGDGNDGGEVSVTALARLSAAWAVADLASAATVPEGRALAAQALGFGSCLASGRGILGQGLTGEFAAHFVCEIAHVLTDSTSSGEDSNTDGLFFLDTANSNASNNSSSSNDLSSTLLPAVRAQLAATAASALNAAAAASTPLPASTSHEATSGLASLPPAAAVHLLAASRWCLDLASELPAATSTSSAANEPLQACRAALRALRLPYAAAAWLAQSDATLGGNSSSNSSGSGSRTRGGYAAGGAALAWAEALPVARWRALAALADAAFTSDVADHDEGNREDPGIHNAGSGDGVDASGGKKNSGEALFFLDTGGDRTAVDAADDDEADTGSKDEAGNGGADLANELTEDLEAVFSATPKEKKKAVKGASSAKKSARSSKRIVEVMT